MKRSLLFLCLTLALGLLAAPAALAASAPGSKSGSTAAPFEATMPVVQVQRMNWTPPGFSSDAAQAVKAAESTSKMQAIHRRTHPLNFVVSLWPGQTWLVDFSYHGKLLAEVPVSPAGRPQGVWTGPQARAFYARGNFAIPFGRLWVLLPFSLLFLVPFLELRRRVSWRLLDGLALLSFLVSYLLFDHAKLVAAVWCVYPTCLYLLARMLWLGGLARRARPGRRARGGREETSLLGRLPLKALGAGLLVIVAGRTALSLIDPTVVDVGFSSVIGAHQIAAGHPLYAAATSSHGDTYGPIAYLAYLPFELLFPWHGGWGYLPSAHAASLVFDLVTIGGLIALGRRLRAGERGWRLGLAFGWAWAACPFTLLALMMHTNDGLIAMLSVLSLLAFASPAARGAVLGLAAAAKFVPAALLGLYAGGRERSARAAIRCVVAFVLLVAVSIGLYLPSGGLHTFYEQTIGFQLTRSDIFSPWALYASLTPVKITVEVLVVLLCAVVAFVPRRRSLTEVSALAGALTIAVQLPAIHWFYYYIVWFAPYVLVAVLAAPEPMPDEPAPAMDTRPEPERELVLAG